MPQEITGQQQIKIEMSSILFIGKSMSAHKFNMIVLNFVDSVC